MKAIYKYSLKSGQAGAYVRVEMPEHAIVYAVREQRGEVCMWAEVDTERPLTVRLFQVFATGQEIPENMGIYSAYVGTCFFDDGNFVFHVYEYLGV